MLRKKTTKDFIEDAIRIHGPDRYDYSSVEYVGAKTKVKILCRKRGHIFHQIPNHHLSGRGCKECAIIERANKLRKPLKDFIEDAIRLHGPDRYDYSLVEYVGSNTSVKIRCCKCGRVFPQKPYKHLQGQGCNECAGTGKTSLEEFIEDAMRVHDLIDMTILWSSIMIIKR